MDPRGFTTRHGSDYFLYLFALHRIEGELLWQWVDSRNKWTLFKSVIRDLCKFRNSIDGTLSQTGKEIIELTSNNFVIFGIIPLRGV